jgi:hypothetical protein
VRVFLAFLLVAMLCCGAQAAEGTVSKVDKGQTAGVTASEPDVCYPEVLTENEKKAGMKIPCGKKYYIYVPLTEIQKHAEHDRSGIWSDKEVQDSKVQGYVGGVWIWEKTINIGATEVTVSMIAAGLCNTMSVCPFRVRLRTLGKPDVVKGWPKIDQACAAGNYFFIRDDFKELVACDEHISLD